MVTLIIRVILIVSMAAWLPVAAVCGEHCGAEGDWKNVLIPDKWPTQQQRKLFPVVTGKLKTVPVYKACQKHDKCYDTPGTDRDQCDLDFLYDIRYECDRVYPGILETPLREACRAAAKGYYKSVHEYGEAAFIESQGSQGVSKKKGEPKSNVSQADLYLHRPVNVSFVLLNALDRTFNNETGEFNVYVSLYKGETLYLVQGDSIGIGLIRSLKNLLLTADRIHPVEDRFNIMMDIDGLTPIPDSKVKIVEIYSTRFIRIDWQDNWLSFIHQD